MLDKMVKIRLYLFLYKKGATPPRKGIRQGLQGANKCMSNEFILIHQTCMI